MKSSNSPLRPAVQEAVTIIADAPHTADERYWLNGYFGAVVYRLAIVDGKIAATIPGGYHDSRPRTEDEIDADLWKQEIHAYLDERLGKGKYKIVKADGSGTHFYLRNPADADNVNVKVYDVPHYQGGMHTNYELK